MNRNEEENTKKDFKNICPFSVTITKYLKLDNVYGKRL
jgi:hypothetical protein